MIKLGKVSSQTKGTIVLNWFEDQARKQSGGNYPPLG